MASVSALLLALTKLLARVVRVDGVLALLVIESWPMVRAAGIHGFLHRLLGVRQPAVVNRRADHQQNHGNQNRGLVSTEPLASVEKAEMPRALAWLAPLAPFDCSLVNMVTSQK